MEKLQPETVKSGPERLKLFTEFSANKSGIAPVTPNTQKLFWCKRWGCKLLPDAYKILGLFCIHVFEATFIFEDRFVLEAYICGQSYKQFTIVIYKSRVLIWAIF